MQIETLKAEIRKFVQERDWERYQTPKNLCIALSIETAELLEVFLWLTDDESTSLSETAMPKLKEELGDIMIYLTNLADRFGLDPIKCAEEKMKANAIKYPTNVVKGSRKKYTEY